MAILRMKDVACDSIFESSFMGRILNKCLIEAEKI